MKGPSYPPTEPVAARLDKMAWFLNSGIGMLACQRFFLKSPTAHRFFPPVGLFLGPLTPRSCGLRLPTISATLAA